MTLCIIKGGHIMSWAHYTYERMQTIYKTLVKEINEGKHQNIEFTMKELLFRAEVLKRDFTKRQLNIISLIFTFSYTYGKEWALIPKMKDFELAGISAIKIRNEINQLVDMEVIEWNQEEHLFKINDPREWKAPYHSGYSDHRSRELFYLNLRHAEIDVESIINSIEE